MSLEVDSIGDKIRFIIWGGREKKGGANQRFALRLGSTTFAWAQNDGGCTRRLAPREKKRQIGYFHRGPTRKAKPCLAEVVRFASSRLRAGSQIKDLLS